MLPLPAAGASVFQQFYDEASAALTLDEPPEDLTDFIIEQMEEWEGDGIVLTSDDITNAMFGRLWKGDGSGLCENKETPSGEEYTFAQGGFGPGSCLSLQRDILSLLDSERVANQLGVDLLAITNGAELAVADEPHRPMNMADLAMVIRRVWSGTGAAAIPWDNSARTEFQDLQTELQNLSKEDLDKVILRFHHGHYRDIREDDPRFDGIGDSVADKLQALADRLGVVDNPRAVGVFAMPKLQVDNVGVWARRDDIGLQWIYPSHITRLTYEEADEYPVLRPQSDKLAYPFAYEGSGIGAAPFVESPVCSRTMGRQGYLCRPLPEPEENCEDPENDAITLVRCDQEATVTESGPRICPDFDQLFLDDGTPLEDPANPGEINPALTTADLMKLCTPERKTLYKDDIESHACYVSYCLLQSMSGHTLVPNRSPVVIDEATSPYLACLRTDPQLGLYTELMEESPYTMPEYQGHFLVRDFDRAYCNVFGNAPLPLGGLCDYEANEPAALPVYTAVFTEQLGEREGGAVRYRQELVNGLAAAVGQRVALDQSAELQRKTFARLANFIDQIASLILELKNAPLTKTPCPWTGHFRSSSAP